MDYIRQGTPFSSYAKKAKLKQCFLHSPRQEINVDNIIALYVDRKIDDDDLKLVEFIWRAEFSVMEQINRFALANNIEHVNERINHLFNTFILNKFFLYVPSGEKGKAPGDAEMIHCLTEGGKALIENYIDEYIVWNLHNLSVSPNIVSKALIDTELMLDIKYGTSIKKMYYQKRPRFYLGKDEVFALNSHYLFDIEGKHFYMVTDVIGSTENSLRLRPRLKEIGMVFETQIWRKYYTDTSQTPLLLFVVDTDEDAEVLAKELTTITRILPENYRITTSERMKKGIGTDESFIMYDKNTETLFETGIPIFK